MKKVLLGIVCFFGVLVAQAQIKSGSLSTQFGVKLGYNANTLTEEGTDFDINGDPISFEDKYSGGSFLLGAYVYKPFTDKLGLQAELSFDRKSFKDGGVTSYFNYLSVPVMVKATISDFGVYAGPNIGMFLSAGDSEDGKYGSDFTEFVKKVPLGLNFGACYNFGNFVADLRYQALGKILDEDGYKLKASSIQVSVGYKLK